MKRNENQPGGEGVREVGAARGVLARSSVIGAMFTVLSVGGVLAGGAGVCGAAGCSKPLLSPEDERTPFDRYDAVRNEYAPQYVQDKFGMNQPNLRARLAPR